MKKIGVGDTGMSKNLLNRGFAARDFDLREERMTYFPMDHFTRLTISIICCKVSLSCELDIHYSIKKAKL
jgi:hypothetical protein